MPRWNTVRWNTSRWNAAGGVLPLARFLTVQPGDELGVHAFYKSDLLYYGFTASSGVQDNIVSATFQVKKQLSDTITLINISIDSLTTDRGAILLAGPTSYVLYFVIDQSVLTPSQTYSYILTATDINNRTASWTGSYRTFS